jgi:hypothetical protein
VVRDRFTGAARHAIAQPLPKAAAVADIVSVTDVHASSS